MSDQASDESKPIRLVFQLDRAENPRLYDDLTGFKKGAKRVNRLRTLAQEGLLAQQYPAFVPARTQTMDQAVQRDDGDTYMISQVFDEPIVNK